MAMSQNTLKSEFTGMGLYGTEVDAIDAWTLAWSKYFEDAETNGIPVEVTALLSAESAMRSALVGMSQFGQGAAKIQAGIIAWWGAIAAAPITFFPGAILVTPPPGLGGIAAALAVVFASNIAGSVSKEDAYSAIAGALHPLNLGGTATFPGAPPPVFPIL
jgi:hypothetical protein